MAIRRGSLTSSEQDDEEAIIPPKRPLDGELDLTSLIDVVFLLLIFFMVSSTMKGTPDVDVPEAHFGTGVLEGDSSVITIRREGLGGPPLILLGDGRGPESAIDGIRPYVEQSFREGRKHVIIKAERDIPHGFVQQVARAISQVQGIRFNIGVQEKR